LALGGGHEGGLATPRLALHGQTFSKKNFDRFWLLGWFDHFYGQTLTLITFFIFLY
jgi:hypothetical protein